ncbi:MAG: methyltransferase domain-containing protein [Chloroflexi bacterium]|nr:methyltransferase domain-containing protein [Chloroflexota bacterium]
MPDIYVTIREVAPDIQERLADVLELRAADTRQQEILHSYLSDIDFPSNAQVLELGCGTGAVTRTLAQWPNVAQAVGIDPSSVFIGRARKLSQGIMNLAFFEGDGRSLEFAERTFDVVVIHTALSHVPQPEQMLAEAFRVLRPFGWLAIFDGDYATATVATGNYDPLEACVHAFREHYINDPWIVRRLPQLIYAAGFEPTLIRSHGYVEAPASGYMMTWIDRGADALASAGRISQELSEALKAEARHRNATNTWFGHIAFASILGRKPA